MEYAVTIYVRVTDEKRLIKKARKESKLDRSERIDVGDALRLLLDRSELLDGAEIQDSNCECVG